MYRLFVGFLMVNCVSAAPIAVESFDVDGKNLRIRDQSDGLFHEFQPGAMSAVALSVPALGDKEKEAGGRWLGVLSVDIYGKIGQAPGRIILEALDPGSGEVFATGTTTITRTVPSPAWTIISSSQQAEWPAKDAFDGDPTTTWKSVTQGAGKLPPHWIGAELGAPTEFSGIRYTPPQRGGLHGVAKSYKLEIRKPGSPWETALEGEAPADSQREPIELKLPSPATVEAFRLVIESDQGGRDRGAAAEIELLGGKLEPDPSVLVEKTTKPSLRAWIEIPEKMMPDLEGKTFGFRIRNSPGAPILIGNPHFSRVHTKPTPALFGRSNGGLGPDKLGAGLLGFDALTEHQQTVLTVMTTHPRSNAVKAKLKVGDVIVAVAGKALPVNDLAPGWNWFNESHEAFIGRQTEAVLATGKRSMPVTVLRDGEAVNLEFPLTRSRAFTTMNPADDPEAAAMLADCLEFVIANQGDDGSWSGDMIKTTFASLALMATGDARHRQKVKKAIDWAQDRYKKPDDYGNLGFWAGGYAGILYAEWHLATGDRSVLKNMEELQNWAANGSHKSAWDVPALGHGPSGLPYENKGLVAPACHLLVFEALATRCKMDSKIWEMLMPYMEMAWSNPENGGHGSLGYNRSYIDTEEFWSRTGLFAIAAHIRGERLDMRDAMGGFMAKNYPWFRNSHAYGEPGGSLGLISLNLVNPEAYAHVMKEYAWWFSLAWEPGYGLRFTTPHMGAPYMGEDDLINATYALVLQAPKKNLHITGSTGGKLW